MLGPKGIDNDGDGLVNEDPIGYIDPNRAWSEGWMPRYIQDGLNDYPLQCNEERNIAEWARGHLNVNAVMSFHNFERWILRGPGAKSQRPLSAADCGSTISSVRRGRKCCRSVRMDRAGRFTTAMATRPITAMDAMERSTWLSS